MLSSLVCGRLVAGVGLFLPCTLNVYSELKSLFISKQFQLHRQ